MVNNTLYHLLVLTWRLRYFWKRGSIRKGCVEIEDWGTSVYFVFRFQENYMRSMSAYKGILKALFSFIPWLLNFSDLPNYGSKSRKRYTLRLLSKCAGRSNPLPIRDKVPSQQFDSFFDSLRWAPFSLALHYVLAKLLQNDAKFIQKLAPGFKNYMRNLDNFRQAVESPKSCNSMGYICPKNTFLQQNHFCENSPSSLYMSFLKQYVIFHNTTRLHYFSSNITYFWQKYPIKAQTFRFFAAPVKMHEISQVIFQTKSESFLKVWVAFQFHER